MKCLRNPTKLSLNLNVTHLKQTSALYLFTLNYTTVNNLKNMDNFLAKFNK